MRNEDELLLYCARRNVNPEIYDKILFLVNGELDWEYLFEIASKNKLTQLLYFNLNSMHSENVPVDFLAKLQNDFNRNVRKNLLLSGELIKIMKLFESEGIKATPYKGPVLALLAYENIAIREFGDIDILINESDILKAKEIMFSAGYELNLPVKISNSSYMKLEPEYQFINKDNSIIVEIKWKLEGNFLYLPLNPNIFFNQMIKIDLNGFKIDTFSPNNQLLILCVHCAKHDWKRLSWICDISEFIKSNIIDWKEVLQKADDLSIKRILFINLILAKDLFGLKLPDEISSSLYNDNEALRVSRRVEEIFFNEKSLNLFEKFLMDMKKREKLSYGIKDCISGLTKPTYIDFKDLSLPEPLFILFCVLRPFLLIRRYGKDSI